MLADSGGELTAESTLEAVDVSVGVNVDVEMVSVMDGGRMMSDDDVNVMEADCWWWCCCCCCWWSCCCCGSTPVRLVLFGVTGVVTRSDDGDGDDGAGCGGESVVAGPGVASGVGDAGLLSLDLLRDNCC